MIMDIIAKSIGLGVRTIYHMKNNTLKLVTTEKTSPSARRTNFKSMNFMTNIYFQFFFYKKARFESISH